MKKIVLTYGLIGGVIMAALMAFTLPFQGRIGFDKSMIVGFTTMIVAFMLVFFGVKAYRDNVAAGDLSFGRAFAVGSLIALVVSLFYVATWEIMYFNFMPDFLDRMQAYNLDKARAAGATAAELAQREAEGRRFAEMYQNPLINSAMTLVEPLPVGLVIALVSAGVLRRRRTEGAAAA